eukprot:m.53649 g.53649  ORF g.53649 m.53649 type:complete len:52 (+) comp16680_c0_seq4:2851-3006(+)
MRSFSHTYATPWYSGGVSLNSRTLAHPFGIFSNVLEEGIPWTQWTDEVDGL